MNKVSGVIGFPGTAAPQCGISSEVTKAKRFGNNHPELLPITAWSWRDHNKQECRLSRPVLYAGEDRGLWSEGSPYGKRMVTPFR
ncbi:MAG: hypothetical protein NTV33_12750 [Coprothermobacterota bacterium]|nr:hypothetical protein [Coprothermobacterota bacterium]